MYICMYMIYRRSFLWKRVNTSQKQALQDALESARFQEGTLQAEREHRDHSEVERSRVHVSTKEKPCAPRTRVCGVRK